MFGPFQIKCVAVISCHIHLWTSATTSACLPTLNKRPLSLSTCSFTKTSEQQEDLSADPLNTPGKSLAENAHAEWKVWNCANYENCPWLLRSSSSRPSVLLKCGKCRMTRYCSKDCQKEHWEQHKFECVGSGIVKAVEQASKDLQKKFDEGRARLIDLEERWQTEKRYLEEAVQRRGVGLSQDEANLGSTFLEKGCKLRMRSLKERMAT